MPRPVRAPRAPAGAGRSAVAGTSLVGAVALLLGGASGCSGSGSEPTSGGEPAWFEDVAAGAGVDFVYAAGGSKQFWFPEIMGGGVALFDYDGDGWLDLYLVQSGNLRESGGPECANRLYKNRGDGTFEDVTAAAGVGDTGYGMGAACGDYDRDGDVDLFVTNVGPNTLYRNNGDGTFTDVTETAGVGHAGWGTSSAFVDVDGDGDLDLFVVNNLAWSGPNEIDCFNYYGEKDYCSPNNYNTPTPDLLYRNDGGDRFTAIASEAGLEAANGNGLGVTWADYDLDGHADVYVANDAMPNQLWHNRGDGTFEDVALLRGCAVNGDGTAEAGMGVQFVDMDQDGDLDLFMTHLRQESNTLYRNRGGVFSDVTHATGMLGRSLKFTGFGMGFADFDLDGRLDLYVANGAVQSWKQPMAPDDSYAEPNLLFRGVGDERFEEVLPEGGTARPAIGTSRGAAFGDYDNDGDVDIVVVERDAPVRILKNVAPRAGHWIELRVLDEHGSDGLGAQLSLKSGEHEWHRSVAVAYSYLSSNDPRVHVGLGEATEIELVRVRWLDGSEESFGPFAADAEHTLRRGTGR